MIGRFWLLCFAALSPAVMQGQESATGLSIPATLSAGGFFTERTNGPNGFDSKWTAGGRAMAYPTLRLNQNWYVGSAIQVATQPYFYESFDMGGYDVRVDVLQAYIAHERYWGRSMVRVKAGQMSTAFGSYMLDYDDGRNPLVDIPAGYGYYYSPVSTLSFSGAEVDATLHKWDLRVQAVTSSPANRRSVFEGDQYLNWTGGAGYTIRQGLRVGASAYHGPYLHREHRFFMAGELNPRGLAATGYGVDFQFAQGHLELSGEVQHHNLPYTAIPTLKRWVGYGQARYAFKPRWFAAMRWGGESSIEPLNYSSTEAAIGYRPNRRQILKASYQVMRSRDYSGASGGTVALQLVTQLDAFQRAF